MHETALRLALAAAIGTLIGLNRDLHGKDAGVRTQSLVAIGAALAVLAIERVVGASDPTGSGVSRAVQGVLTGVGFLGAGVILHDASGQRVYGLTTAATIWVTAVFGVACGVGAYAEVAAGVALVFAILWFGGPLEERLERARAHRRGAGASKSS